MLNKNTGKIQKGDIILIICIAAVAGVVALYYALTGGGAFHKVGKKTYIAVIRADGAEYCKQPLSEDARIEYGADGRTNIILVENGAVRMESANCPDKYCVSHRPLDSPEGIIVCLPNRITVKIENIAKKNSGPDVIVHN